MVSFKEYLETCRFSNSPEAEFVAEALGDRDLHKAKTWPELQASLKEGAVSQRFTAAAEAVWRDYEMARAKA